MNIRLIVRSLLKNWRFSLFVVAILGAGIALNTATFTIANGILFQPLPVREPERLARVFMKAPWGDGFWPQLSFPEYLELRDESRSFESLAAFANDLDLDVSIEGQEPLRAHGTIATGNFFRTLGVAAEHGRFFGAADDRAGNAVAVISHDFRRRHFDARTEVLGETIRLNEVPFTIIGVAPRRFHGVVIDVPSDVWIPSSMATAAMTSFPDLLTMRNMGWISVVGRLRGGVTQQQAQAEVRTIAARHAAVLKQKDPTPAVYGATETAFDTDRRPQVIRLVLLFGIFVAIVLIIACVNAGSLQLVRGERRQRELAIRAAVGASRGKLLRELTIEGVILALASGAFGLLLAHALVSLTFALAPPSLPLMLHASLPVIDGRVALVAFALTALASLACGFVPALRVTRIDLQRSIRGDQSVGRAATVRAALVIVQIALSVVVLIAAGLMIRTLRNIRDVDPGFPLDGAVTATVSLSRQGYDQPRAIDFFARLQERLASTPGVTGVAVGQTLPMSSGGMMASVTAGGRDEHSPMNLVAPGYFAALGVPLLHGRDFNALDRKEGENVAIVNDTFARSFWRTADVVDRRFVLADIERRVVGVVRTTKYSSLREEPVPMAFVPRAQAPTKSAEIAIRTRGDEATAAVLLRDAVRSLDRDVPVHDLQSLRERVGTAWHREEALASVLTIFGALAMLLAAVGLFSVVSYRTETRRKELGIRIAVGANARDILSLVVRHTATLLLAGIAAGLIASALVGRLAETFLYAVTPFDAITFAIVAIVFFATGLVAAWLPARRASRIDATQMLRAE